MKKHDNSGTILQFRRPDREAMHKEQLSLDAYNAFVAKLGEPRVPMILFPVPNGAVSVTISHPEVSSGVAVDALAFIRQAIQENGIPKDAVVGLTGVNMRGAEQKRPEFKRDTARVHRRGGERRRPQMKGIKKDPEIQKEQQRPVDELSDEELETAVAEGGDTHVILVPVPKGFVSVSILGAEVTPGVAIGALSLISALIKETGIPKEKLVQLGGCVNIGQKQKA
jgi:hypothetical protein